MSFCHAHHGLHNFIHAAHGVPRPQAGVGVVHQAVKRGRVFRLGPQEKHRKLHDLEQLGMGEMLPGEGAERREQRKARGVHHGLPFRKLEGVVGRLGDKLAHADVVLDFRFRHEVPELLACACFNGLEDGGQCVQARWDLKRPIVKPNCVGGIQTHQVHLLVHVCTKVCEVPLEHIGHPVPTGAHVKGESFRLKLPCPASKGVVALKHANSVARLGQISGGGESCKASAQYQNVAVWRGRLVHGIAFGCLVQPPASVRCSLIAFTR